MLCTKMMWSIGAINAGEYVGGLLFDILFYAAIFAVIFAVIRKLRK